MSTGSRHGDKPLLGNRFREALQYASELHAGQVRKGSPVPYFAHLMSVAALVLEDGGGEEEAIAALLHDAVEDQGGDATRDEIRRRFGDRVAGIVEDCSDAWTKPKPPWQERKERHIERLRSAPGEVLRVMAADKLHNARSLVGELQRDGEAIWSRFRGGRDGTLWYYRTLTELLTKESDGPLARELARVVGELERLAG